MISYINWTLNVAWLKHHGHLCSLDLVVTSHTSKLGVLPWSPLLPSWLEKIDNSRTWAVEYYRTDLHPQPVALRQVLCFSDLSQSPEHYWNVLKHKTSQNTEPNKLAKCPPRTRAPQMSTRKFKPVCSFSSFSFLRAFVARVRSPWHDHGAINTAQETSTKNSQPSPSFVKMCLCLLFLCCRCHWPVLIMISISETLGNNNWPPKSPTPLKSPTQTMDLKGYRSSAYCVSSKNERC